MTIHQLRIATLVCRKEDAEQIKQLHGEVGKRVGEEFL